MSSSALKKLRSYKPKNVGPNNNELNINSLNIDCLIRIFEELSFEDRLKVEMVCKRWNEVGKLSWCNVKTLTVNKRIKSGLEYYSKQAKTDILTNVIKRSGAYLNDVCIRNDLEENYSIIFKMLLKHCKNLHKFSIVGGFNQRFLVEKNLEILLKENKKLSNVSLRYLYFQSQDFLLCLQLEKITELTVSDCNFVGSVDYFINLFSKMVNLKKLRVSINPYNENSKNIIFALNQNNYQGLEDLGFSSWTHGYSKEFLHNLLNFIVKQKNLLKLDLRDIILDPDFVESLLELNLIEELGIRFITNIPRSIGNLKNLTILKCYVGNLTDECIKNLTKCLNLKKINLFMRKTFLTHEGENQFSEFRKLESFKFNTSHLEESCTDNILKNLSSCEFLKHLTIESCNISDMDVASISLMKNLLLLNLSFSTITNNQIIKIVGELSNLETINVYGCSSLTYNFLKTIDDVKINRGDKIVLKVLISKYSHFTKNLIENQEELKNLKLISFSYYDYVIE